MPVELNIVESVTELDTTVVEVNLVSASEPGPAGPGVPAGGSAGQVLTKDSGTDYDTSWQASAGGGVTDADYLVGTAHAGLSAEIVVGTSPGGELGGTWASPTVDATHSGSSHAAVQAAAEATAAAALAAHEADSTGIHGIADTSALETTAGAQGKVDTHSADTTSVHGIADTSAVALTADVVTKALYDANTILKADSDNTPAALAMGASTILARLAAGNIVAATPTEIRTLLGLVIGTNVQAWDADLDTYAGITPSANVQSVLAAANYAAIRTLLDLEAGTDFPAQATFDDHSARHENGGGDEISVAGLSGELADAQPVTIRKNTGADVGTRSRLNLIEGTNVTLTVTDDAGSDEVDITIAASGTGGGVSFAPSMLLGGY